MAMTRSRANLETVVCWLRRRRVARNARFLYRLRRQWLFDGIESCAADTSLLPLARHHLNCFLSCLRCSNTKCFVNCGNEYLTVPDGARLSGRDYRAYSALDARSTGGRQSKGGAGAGECLPGARCSWAARPTASGKDSTATE